MKISPLLLFIVLLFASLKAQGPLTWNINSSYTHPALVINGSTTYISLKDVPSGISITSNSYWSTLDSYIPTETPSGSDAITTPDASEVEGLTVPPSVSHDNFYFGFSHIKEEGASDFLLNSVGIKEYSEWQSPPLTYFGPSANGNESILTYKFEFSGDVVSARARVNLGVWNFNAPGAFGSGQGTASAWASTDGQAWVNLINLPVPQTFSSGQTFEDMLPESVLGTKEIYLQIRMEVSGAPNSSYTTAQFGRSDANAPKDIFYLDANYTSSVSHSDGLIAYYPFDGNASDMSGNNNHGVVYGASLSEDRFGRLSHAYNFDGDDWIELPHDKLLDGQSNVTIAAWYKLNNGAGEGQIISSGDYRGGNDPIHLRLGPSGSTQFSLHNISTPYTYSSMNSRWYHLAVVLKSDESSSQLTVFINGENIAYSEKTLQVIYYDVNMPTIIGALEGRPFYSSPGQFFNGSIDDVRIYNRAFTSTEIDELFESEKPKYPSSASFFDIDAQSQNNEVSFSAPKSSYYKVVLNALPDAKFDVISYWSPPNQWMSGFQYSVDSGSPIDHRFGPFPSKEEAFSAFEDLVLFLDEGQLITFSDPDFSLFDNSGGTSLVLYPIIYNDSFDPSDGLVAYYPLDGNASDMSGNGNDGTVYGATLSIDRNGDAGNSYFFDGVNDWIEVENHESFNFAANDPFTISAWVKPHQLSSKYSPKSIIEKWSESGGYPFVLRSYQDSGEKTIGFGRYDGSSGVGVQIKDDNLLSAFGHVTAVSDGMKVAIFYNGLEQDSEDFSLSDTKNNSSLFFGKRGPNLEFFNGSIDDVRIYNRALSSTEVYELYELEKPFDPNEGLVAYFPFDGNALDMSGNGNDGTVYGATLSTDRNGDANKAYSFDGVNDWIDVGGPSALTNGENQTISVWVQGTGDGPAYWNDDTQAGGDIKLILLDDQKVRFGVHSHISRSSSFNFYSEESLDPTEWSQLVITISNGLNYKLYINGTISSSYTDTDSIKHDNRTDISIGGATHGNHGFFNGSIDEVRHYVRTLSDREVAALYELERPHFDFAHCMEKLPGGSLIAIPKGYAAPGGLTLKSRGEEYDLYEVTGMVTTMEQTIETGKALGRIEGKSEVLANPSAYGLFTESDLNSTRENAWSEGQMIGRSFGELSVINQPGSFGLKSEADFNSAKSNALIEGHSEILDKVVNIVKSIADTNELDIPDSLRTYSYSDFVDENGSVYLDEIEFAIEQFIDFADSATTSPYTNGWFYSRNLGWMWTDKTVFPYFFRSEGGWIYFKKGFNQPRFYNYETKKWFDVKE